MAEKLERGWKRVKFGDVVRQVKDKVDPATSGLERYIAGEHMDTDDLRLRRWGTIGDDYLGPAFHMRFKPGQVLYGSRRTYLRKVAVADFEGICSNTTFVLEPKDPQALLPEYLPFLMQTEAFHEHSKRESKGSVNPYVNFSDLAWWAFALPPLEEQRRITTMLFKAEEATEVAETAVRAADDMRRSLLIQTFRPDRGSTDTFPSHWQVVRMEDAGHIQLGQQRHPKFSSGSNVRPYLRVANVQDGVIDYADVLSMHFPEGELDKFELRKGDVLLNEGQSTELVGRSAIYGGGVPGLCFQKTLIRFRCGPRLLPAFAQAYFQHCLYTGQFARMVVQTTSMAHLTAVRFAAMRIPVPPLVEQQEFAAQMEAILAALGATRERAEDFRSLKRQMFSATSEAS